jgi:hypothetical protein
MSNELIGLIIFLCFCYLVGSAFVSLLETPEDTFDGPEE